MPVIPPFPELAEIVMRLQGAVIGAIFGALFGYLALRLFRRLKDVKK